MMQPFNIAAGAPPSLPPKATVPVTVDPKQIAVAEVIEKIRQTQPFLYSELSNALHDLLDPEFQHIIRVPPDKLQTSQGRAQVAQDVIGAIDNCAEIVRRKKASGLPTAPSRPLPPPNANAP